ncbi:MaoC family dehydratase [Roseibium aggregatum]|uniref:MaoC family dehydratase n=1 Tax=Roseibium aggregatum TaxID=187304 RepID=A0A939J2A8_9HYPH|nr:MaoC family dehydratase [Roseibium aggregatum]MBN9673001.1 MaoC family dehydratase [Roseibium aggregatum]
MSEWELIDEDRTRAYADLTDDHNPLHLDNEFARETPLGRTIAHGTVTLAQVMRLLERSLGAEAVARGELRVRFQAPVYVGTRVRAVLQAAEMPDMPLSVAVECEDGRTTLSGTFIPEARS